MTFLIGAFLGSVATYGVLRGLLVEELHLDHATSLGLIGTAGVLGSLRDLGAKVPVPYLHKQVPEWFRGILPLPVTSLSYGFLLGLGFATKFTYGAHLTLVAVLATTASIPTGVVALAVYALVRTIASSAGKTDIPAGVLTRVLQGRRRTVERYLRPVSVALTTSLVAIAVIATV